MFELGRVAVNEGARLALLDSGQSAEEFVQRHQAQDWGDITEETLVQNRKALEEGGALHSIYHTAKGEKIIVVTDADRGATVVSLPQEY